MPCITGLEGLRYYPFGMLIEGLSVISPANDYTYNGKELNEDFGLNLYDYGARWYDATVGRWWSVDPMAMEYENWSSYHYVLDNPMIMVDPTGMDAKSDAMVMMQWQAYYENKDAGRNEQARQKKIQKGMEDAKDLAEDAVPTVHIIVLPGAKVKTVDKAIKKLEKCAQAAGINVAFKKEDNKFNSTIPVSDAIVVVGGDNAEAAKYIMDNVNKDYMSDTYQEKIKEFGESNGLDYPETTDGWGAGGWSYVVATSTQLGKISVTDDRGGTHTGSAMDKLSTNSPSDALALIIFHSMGHLSGLHHSHDDYGIMNQGPGGQLGLYMAPFKGNVVQAVAQTFHDFPQIAASYQHRFSRPRS